MQRPYEFDWWFSTMLWMVLYLNKRALSLHAILLRSTLRRVERSASSTHTAKKKTGKQTPPYTMTVSRISNFRILQYMRATRDWLSCALSKFFFFFSEQHRVRIPPISDLTLHSVETPSNSHCSQCVFIWLFYMKLLCAAKKARLFFRCESRDDFFFFTVRIFFLSCLVLLEIFRFRTRSLAGSRRTVKCNARLAALVDKTCKITILCRIIGQHNGSKWFRLYFFFSLDPVELIEK